MFIGYLVFFAYLITRTSFFRATGLSKPQLVIIFLLKVIAGIFYGWVGTYYGQLAQMADTWNYHYQGVAELRILSEHPAEYFTNIFHNPYQQGLSNFFGSESSYWNDLKSNVFIKFLSVFDVFTGGLYYVNVILYTFCVLFGPMALYRVMIDLFPGRKVAVVIGVFFIPSFFYWGSGMHKEGLIFLGIAFITYGIYFARREKSYRAKHILFIAAGLLLLLLLRNFVLMLILPAVFAWFLANRWPGRAVLVFSAIYLLCILLFFTTRYIIPQLDFPAAVVAKQEAFTKLTGGSSQRVRVLTPTLGGFLINAPQAMALAATRPHPSDISHLLSLAAALEVWILVLLLSAALIFRVRWKPSTRPTILFFLFFSLSLLLAIGFSVNNIGAIARYRSVILPLVMTPVLALTDWDRIIALFSRLDKKAIPS